MSGIDVRDPTVRRPLLKNDPLYPLRRRQQVKEAVRRYRAKHGAVCNQSMITHDGTGASPAA